MAYKIHQGREMEGDFTLTKKKQTIRETSRYRDLFYVTETLVTKKKYGGC